MFNLAMNLISLMGVGSDTTNLNDGADTPGFNAGGLSEGLDKVTSTVRDIIEVVLPVIFAVILSIGVIYGIILGINYAKAEDTQKREEAKKRLVNAIIGFGIAVILAAVMWILSGTALFDSLFVG